MPVRRNVNRVLPAVLSRAVIGAVVAVAAAFLFDKQLSQEQIGGWADAILVILGLLGVGGGATWGAQRATKDVTPVLPGDTPRDLDGNELVPVSHTPATGYPPTRAATPEERPLRRRQPPTAFP